MSFLWISPISGVVAVCLALCFLLALRNTRVRPAAVAETAGCIALGARTRLSRQFRTIKGHIEGKARPGYAAWVDIAVPTEVGRDWGARALGSLHIGAVASAALLGPFFHNTGTAFDNAKKIIARAGQRGTFQHQAAVVGDTVGDHLKDVAGPSLLLFMKPIGMAALLIASRIEAM